MSVCLFVCCFFVFFLRSNTVLYVLSFYLQSKQMEISEERYARIQTFVIYLFYLTNCLYKWSPDGHELNI